MTDVNGSPHPITKKGYIKPFLFSMLTLASGVIIGAAATAMILDKPTKPDPSEGLEWWTERLVGRMTYELSLTPEQKGQVFPIIREHFGNIDTIREEARPKIETELEEMNAKLRLVFDDHQRMKWDESIRQMSEGFPGMRRGSGPGGQRGPGRGQRGPGRMGEQNENRQGMEGGEFRPNGTWRRRSFGPFDPNQSFMQPPEMPTGPNTSPSTGGWMQGGEFRPNGTWRRGSFGPFDPNQPFMQPPEMPTGPNTSPPTGGWNDWTR